MTRDHDDHPTAEDFRFDEDRHLAVYVCQHVVDGAPILEVAHDPDGDWQFLCGQDHGEDDSPVVWCLEHAVARDPSMNELAEMCTSHTALRGSVSAPWTINDDGEDFIRRCIAEHGWAVQIIDEDDEGPGFAYTVGLHASYAHPELIMLGQPPAVMHSLLNVCGDRIKAGKRLPVGPRVQDILDDFDVRFHKVEDPASFREHVGYALWYYGDQPFGLLQLVWPDKKNLFHADPGAAAYLEEAQPLLP